MNDLHQGDILKVEHIKHLVFVASKDFFNTSNMIIGCPIVERIMPGPLHIWVSSNDIKGYVLCEELKLLDLSIRGYKKVGNLPIDEIMNITDAIQGIFDYI